MKFRCTEPNCKDYSNYGGRGIKIEESFDTFRKFFDWSINNGYNTEDKLSIDRINNDGNYSSNNCRWVSKAENNRNTSRCVLNWELVKEIRYGKYKEMSPTEISKILNTNRDSIKCVINNKTWVE
jgi:hypothetical protein